MDFSKYRFVEGSEARQEVRSWMFDRARLRVALLRLPRLTEK
jgi:hypothetical protein